MTADAIAARAKSALEPMRLLLEACVSEGLLTKTATGSSTRPVVDAFLVSGRPAYSERGIKYAEDLSLAWGRLSDLVRTGRPPMPPETILGDDKEKTRNFVLAMHERAHGIGSVLRAPDRSVRTAAPDRRRRRAGHLFRGACPEEPRTERDGAGRPRRARR